MNDPEILWHAVLTLTCLGLAVGGRVFWVLREHRGISYIPRATWMEAVLGGFLGGSMVLAAHLHVNGWQNHYAAIAMSIPAGAFAPMLIGAVANVLVDKFGLKNGGRNKDHDN